MFHKNEKIELVQLIQELQDPNHPRVTEAQQAVKHAQPIFGSAQTLQSIYLSSLGVPLVEKLQHTQPLAPSKSYVLYSGFGGCGFNAGSAASILLKITDSTSNAEFAVNWLEDLLRGGPRNGTLIMLLSDIEVEHAIELPRGVTLIPARDLELHSTYQSLLKNPNWDSASIPHHSFWRSPKAALVKRYTLQQFLYNNEEALSDTELGELGNLFDDIRAALTLVGPCAPNNVGCWFHFDDPYLAAAAGLSYSRGLETDNWPRFTNAIPISAEDLIHVVSTYLSLPQKYRLRLRPALDRFNKALQQRPTGDKALDLAVVLESLIIGDKRGEIGFRLALRCAQLLSGSLDERRKTKAMVKALYDQRSALAHMNSTSSEVKISSDPVVKKSLYDFLSDCEILVNQVLRVLLTRGEITDAQWADIELGGEVLTNSNPD